MDIGELAHVALESERRIAPGTRRLADFEQVGHAKRLLIRETVEPIARTGLRLHRLRSGADWSAYLDQRIHVESSLGVSEETTRMMIARMRERECEIEMRTHAAAAGGSVVGAVAWFPVDELHGALRLQDVDVFPQHRGRGFGNQLLESVRAAGRDDERDWLVVAADEDDWPIGWYERMGFVPTARVAKIGPT